MDLDEDKVTNSMEEAARQAALAPQAQAPAAPGGAPAVPGVQDMTGGGGGNIGIGAAATPGEQGFSGNVQQQAVPPQA